MDVRQKVNQIMEDSDFNSLPFEERRKISRYMTQQQILTLWQVMENYKDYESKVLRDKLRDWLENVIIGYEVM